MSEIIDLDTPVKGCSKCGTAEHVYEDALCKEHFLAYLKQEGIPENQYFFEGIKYKIVD